VVLIDYPISGFAAHRKSVILGWRLKYRNKMTFAGVLVRWFPDFPGGPAGLGLLIGRVALGLIFIAQGRFYLIERDPIMWFLGAVSLLLGVFLTLGFLTPVAGSLGMIGGVMIWLTVIPDCSSSLSHSNYSLFLMSVLILQVLLVGPGAYSIDARIFGRREIVIPRTHPYEQ
jgi:uncharacterized membrane protein YphA (DoxX/SURF4 family)